MNNKLPAPAIGEWVNYPRRFQVAERRVKGDEVFLLDEFDEAVSLDDIYPDWLKGAVLLVHSAIAYDEGDGATIKQVKAALSAAHSDPTEKKAIWDLLGEQEKRILLKC